MLSFLELEYREIDNNQNISKIQVENCLIDAILKDSTQISVLILKNNIGNSLLELNFKSSSNPLRSY